jgi:hypothetical protein
MNIIGHGASTIDWETSFRFAIIFAIILTWSKSRETKENRSSKNLEQKKEGKNEKDLYIHNHFDGSDSLHSAPGPGA